MNVTIQRQGDTHLLRFPADGVGARLSQKHADGTAHPRTYEAGGCWSTGCYLCR